jgi:hypothetical protein
MGTEKPQQNEIDETVELIIEQWAEKHNDETRSTFTAHMTNLTAAMTSLGYDDYEVGMELAAMGVFMLFESELHPVINMVLVTQILANALPENIAIKIASEEAIKKELQNRDT